MNSLFSRAATTTILVAGAFLFGNTAPAMAQADDNSTAVGIQMATPAVTRDVNNNVIFRVTLTNNGANDAAAGKLSKMRITDTSVAPAGQYQGAADVNVPAIPAGQSVTIEINLGPLRDWPAGSTAYLKGIYYEPNKRGLGFASDRLTIPPMNKKE